MATLKGYDFITNQGLFQDYYLTQRLAASLPLAPDEQRDPDVARQQSDQALQQVFALWQRRQPTFAASEDNVVDFVKDVARILGMSASGQSYIQRSGLTSLRADVTLFGNDAAIGRFAHSAAQDHRTRFRETFTVAEVKGPGKELDNKRSDDTNPSYQISQYLTYSGLDWGILSDGARWRIYHRSDPPRTDVYLEVNLGQILVEPDPTRRAEMFYWFYAFFGKTAFDRFDRRSFLDTVLAGSNQHAIGLQRDLRRQAFSVVQELANGIHVTDPSLSLDEVNRRATVILYRLLFTKYAEDRAILPVENHTYRNRYGFHKMESEMLDSLDKGVQLGASKNRISFWHELDSFFAAIDSGDPDVGIYPYDGGLFHPEQIADTTVPDLYLAQAVDKLARVPGADGSKVQVDYRELEGRHLGSIYEGLLEQSLASDERGQLVLVSAEQRTASQRHDTGSYYTPDYVVDYIVSQTVDPLCRGKDAAAIAALKLLDPAMGSGHFLTAALHRLAQWHARAGKAGPRAASQSEADYAALVAAQSVSHDELLASLRHLAERCIYGVDLNPLAVELAKLTLWIETLSRDRPLFFLDHHLKCGDSLLGVPLNLAAVGQLPLQKLTRKAAAAAAAAAAGQINAFEYNFEKKAQTLISFYQQIQSLSNDDPAEVSAKQDAYRQFEAQVEPFRYLADAWLAPYFGIAVDDAAYRYASEQLAASVADWQAASAADNLPAAAALGQARRFFHWQLEFPDVFYGRVGGFGFDAVVGNPPYVRQERLGEKVKSALAGLYPAIFDSIADLSLYFFGRGLGLLREGGALGFISSDKFMVAGYGRNLREYLSAAVSIETIIDFGDRPVFGEAITYPAIYIIGKQPPADHEVQIGLLPKMSAVIAAQPVNPSGERELAADKLRRYIEDKGGLQAALSGIAALPQSGRAFHADNWILDPTAARLVERLEAIGVPLGEYVDGQIKYGIKTGLDKVFIIDESVRTRLVAEDARSTEIIKPLATGRDISRYRLEPEGRYLILTYIGVPINDYPAVFRYLQQYQADLEHRSDQGNYWWELRPCDYYPDFEQIKIMYPDLASSNRFTIDEFGYYASNTAYIIPKNDKYLLALLNSRLIWFYIQHNSSPYQADTFRLIHSYMKKVPIVKPEPTTPPDERAQLAAEGRRLYELWLGREGAGEMEAWLAARMAGEQGQCDVLADLLAMLAGEMLRLHGAERDEQQRFLADRSREWGAAIDSLAGREAIRNYAGGDFARFVTAVKRNARILARAGIDLNRDRDYHRLETNFNDSLTVLGDLRQQIARSDELIDRAVYALYRLSAAEVAVVAGANGL